ncbi:hypothetical protein H5410_013708 [Solanum commersonii]|uniref:Uncharacterized protein n=1 Tax=Solanum commersonii TaxID=4109 RepID=A0A9J5ZP66_SOLCO|nr:hypothetical protein H5410_013708 [Solanum commersonii]
MRDRILTKVQATIGFISGVTAPKLVNHKRIHTPKDVIEDIRELYGVEISYQQAWRAKERALEILKGKPLDGYKQMPRYIWMLNKVYPNSYIRMQRTEDNQFMYLFITLRPLVRGFDYYKLVVVVDGAHLGRAYKCTFVSVSTLDGAGCILSLAYGVVDTENDLIVHAYGIFGRIFQQDEIPCAHTIAVLKHKNVKDMHPYCSDYYKPDALAKTYEVAMVPMPDKEDWTVPDYVLDEIVLPPRYRRLVG